MSFSKSKRQETIIYLALWTTLFMAPVMNLLIRSNNTAQVFQWSEVMIVWREYAVFFLAFLLHNHLLAPLLVYRQRKALYFTMVGLLAVVFCIYQCAQSPADELHGPRPDMADHGHGPGGPPPEADGFWDEPRGESHTPHPTLHMHEPHMDKPDGQHPPMLMEQHDIVALVILVLMLGMNLGVKLYFKQRRDQKQLALLEKQNLEQQLEYLRYQINPHFLMNTLNNIHALVDIDPEKAKQTIVGLSKIMRFVLYEGSKQTVPLGREVDFLRDYIRLMSLRYTDRVRITVDIPDLLPDSEIPPLMFITFVENAFKHGVSYRQESFVEVSLSVAPSDGKRHQPSQEGESAQLMFTCRNSKIPQSDDHHGGVGLQNVKQRLELIYGKNYTLNIDDTTDTYTIRLTLPL